MNESHKKFKEKIKDWNKNKLIEYRNTISEHVDLSKMNLDLKKLGLSLYVANPNPLTPAFEYEKNAKYVEARVKITQYKTSKEILADEKEIEEFEWQIKEISRKIGD